MWATVMDTTLTRQSVRTWLLCAVIVVVAFGAIGAVSGQQDAPSPSITIEVEADGNATWTVTNTVELTTDEQRAAFDELAGNRSQRQALLAERVGPYESVATQASRQLNRSMDVDPESISIDRTDNTGAISWTFRWNQFASTDGDTVTVGDVFTGGFTLSEDRTLTIEGPDGYRLVSNNAPTDGTTVDDASLTVDGPANLTEDNTLVFAPRTPTVTPTPSPTAVDDTPDSSSPTGTETPAEGTTPGEDGPGFGLLVALVAVALALLVARYR